MVGASHRTNGRADRDGEDCERLHGANAVYALPPATRGAFRDHGEPRAMLGEDGGGARVTLDEVAKHVSLDEITTKLTDDGVKLFAEAFDKLLAAVEAARNAA